MKKNTKKEIKEALKRIDNGIYHTEEQFLKIVNK